MSDNADGSLVDINNDQFDSCQTCASLMEPTLSAAQNECDNLLSKLVPDAGNVMQNMSEVEMNGMQSAGSSSETDAGTNCANSISVEGNHSAIPNADDVVLHSDDEHNLHRSEQSIASLESTDLHGSIVVDTQGGSVDHGIVAQNQSSDCLTQAVVNTVDQGTVNGCLNPRDTNSPIIQASQSLNAVVEQREYLVARIDENLSACDTSRYEITGLSEYVELKNLCHHLQTMVEQQLQKQERLQAQNELLAKQVSEAKQISSAKRQSVENSEMQSATRVSVLEATVSRLQKELEAAQGTISSHVSSGKQNTKLEQITRLYEECKRDKELMVVKYAQAEQRNMELTDSVQKAETRVKEWSREREKAISRFNAMQADNSRLTKNLETKTSELAAIKRDLEHQKELSSSADVQAKFHQNRLKEEQERTKEAKLQLEEMTQSVKELMGDLDWVAQELHDLKLFLEVQQVAGFPLSSPQIKDAIAEMVKKQEKNIKYEACAKLLKEVAEVLSKQRDLTEELVKYQEKVKHLESERLQLVTSTKELENQLQNQQQGAGNLMERVAEVERLQFQLKQQSCQLSELMLGKSAAEQTRDDLLAEIERHRKQQADSLEFTQRITAKNSQLQSEQIHLSSEVQSLTKENESYRSEMKHLADKNNALQAEIYKVKEGSEHQRIGITRELNEQTRIVRDLKQRVQDLEDEIKTINRRHAANVKDLTRQLQAANRRLEVQDGKGGVLHSDQECVEVYHTNTVVDNVAERPPLPANEAVDVAPVVVEVVKVDRKMLLDKIVSLQKKLARKNEKIDFLEDHVKQLVEDINRKSRIIKSYIVTQDTGAMSSEKSDKVKAQLSRKGGVMASLYSAQCQDGRTMTVELALEICNKLQELLEDTLLKNITLKESMDTLGEQVERLLQENRLLRNQTNVTEPILVQLHS